MPQDRKENHLTADNKHNNRAISSIMRMGAYILLFCVVGLCHAGAYERCAYWIYAAPRESALCSSGETLLRGDIRQITAEEERIQAAFIWQFLQFIEFPLPISHQEPFIIGIVGITRVEGFLTDILRQKQLSDGRAPEVRKITNYDDLARCSVVFVAPTEAPRFGQILSKTRSKPIVTISRDADFLEKGGLLNFYIENDKVRFEYNLDELPATKLRFSSKILRLGRQFTKK